MPDTWVIAGYILIPIGFGLVPGLLPPRVPLTARWTLWLALLALSALYVSSLEDAPDPYFWLALVPFWLSSLLSLCVLVAEARRAGRSRRKAAEPRR
jgi:hypothetical protein